MDIQNFAPKLNHCSQSDGCIKIKYSPSVSEQRRIPMTTLSEFMRAESIQLHWAWGMAEKDLDIVLFSLFRAGCGIVNLNIVITHGWKSCDWASLEHRMSRNRVKQWRTVLIPNERIFKLACHCLMEKLDNGCAFDFLLLFEF